MEERIKCTVREGRFVEPCDTLAQAVDNNIPGFSKAKGVFRQDLTNMKTKQPSRTYFGLKSKQFPNGLLFNCCPWCGERIDAPFNKEEATNA
jgi:hypothetical protein